MHAMSYPVAPNVMYSSEQGNQRARCWKALGVHIIWYILFKRRQRNTRDLARETDVSGVKIHGGTAKNDSVVVKGV